MTRLLRTLRYLRPRQLAYQLYYRLSGRLRRRPPPGPPPPVANDSPTGPPLPPGFHLPPRWFAPARFTFLNRTVDFGSAHAIDWNYAGEGKLWTYNLNYFEFLRQPAVDAPGGLALIRDWITKAATHRDGWEPYPLSLRLVNWGQFLRSLPGPPPRDIRDAYVRQYADLWAKLEYHLDGNHLLENALALAYAARWLGDGGGRRRADRLLRRQLREQYLPDGAHYELSPTYQLVLLWRQLDLLSLDPAAIAPALVARQLGWVVNMRSPHSGRYPHFNDSAPGIAPTTRATLAYAAALAIEPAAQPLAQSGYRHWVSGPLEVWIDAAAIGPDHIPGHAHADNLTFELHLGGRPLIVDPAISTYEKNARRQWERATAAHNTVTVAGGDSSEVWGGFRVGRRARTTILGEVAGASLIARHDGYPGGHLRSFTLDGRRLLITDCVRGPATARFHFDHTREPQLTGDELRCGPLTLRWRGATGARLKEYHQAVGWNELRPANCLELTFADELTVVLRGE